jgi:Predicted glutamine amidotransferases
MENVTVNTLLKIPKRDLEELLITGYAIENRLPIIGICRGAQMLCVVAGGKLIQDISHKFLHNITIFDTKRFGINKNTMEVNSMHHQLQYPYNIKNKNEYDIIASIKTNPVNVSTGGSADISVETLIKKGEPEIVYYPKINGLAIQFHPEHMFNINSNHDVFPFLQSCINETILKNIKNNYGIK